MASSENCLLERFTEADIMELFGQDSELAFADGEFMDQFRNTFVQRLLNDGSLSQLSAGVEGSPAIPPEVASTAFKLRFSAKVFNMSGGIPSSNQIPLNTPSVDYVKDLKLPVGILHLLYSDVTFKCKLSSYVYNTQRPFMAQKCSSQCCAACGRSDVHGFVTFNTISTPEIERWPCSLFEEGAEILLEHVFPACEDLDCNRKLEEFIQRVGEKSYLEVRQHELRTCSNCKKVEVRGTTHDFRKCSRCKLHYYCSPDCQKADWKRHKKICKKRKESSEGQLQP